MGFVSRIIFKSLSLQRYLYVSDLSLGRRSRPRLSTGQETGRIEISADSLEPSWVTGLKLEAESSEAGPRAIKSISSTASSAHVHRQKGFSVNAPVARGNIDADVVFDNKQRK